MRCFVPSPGRVSRLLSAGLTVAAAAKFKKRSAAHDVPGDSTALAEEAAYPMGIMGLPNMAPVLNFGQGQKFASSTTSVDGVRGEQVRQLTTIEGGPGGMQVESVFDPRFGSIATIRPQPPTVVMAPPQMAMPPCCVSGCDNLCAPQPVMAPAPGCCSGSECGAGAIMCGGGYASPQVVVEPQQIMAPVSSGCCSGSECGAGAIMCGGAIPSGVVGVVSSTSGCCSSDCGPTAVVCGVSMPLPKPSGHLGYDGRRVARMIKDMAAKARAAKWLAAREALLEPATVTTKLVQETKIQLVPNGMGGQTYQAINVTVMYNTTTKKIVTPDLEIHNQIETQCSGLPGIGPVSSFALKTASSVIPGCGAGSWTGCMQSMVMHQDDLSHLYYHPAGATPMMDQMAPVIQFMGQ